MAQRYINVGSSVGSADGDPTRVAFQKTNDNFTEVFASLGGLSNQVGSLSTEIEQAYATLSSYGDNLRGLNAEVISFRSRIQTLENTVGDGSDVADLKRRMSLVESGIAACASQVASIGKRVDGLYLTLPFSNRPGEVPEAFTTDLYSGISGVPSSSQAVSGSDGLALRVRGASLIAPVALCPLEINRLYKIRVVLSRVNDGDDPAGNGVRFGIAWYDGSRNLLSTSPRTSLMSVALKVSDGRQVWFALVSTTPGFFTSGLNDPLPAIAVPPVGAVSMRPFLETFEGGVTDLVLVDSTDVSDNGVTNLSADFLAQRLAYIEARLNITAA